MRKRSLVVVACAGIVFFAGTSVSVHAQSEAILNPDRVLKGTTPIVTITLEKSIPEIKSVYVAGQDAPVQQPLADGKVSVQLPKLDIVGRTYVVVVGKDDKPAAVGQLTYAESAEAPSTPAPESSRGLALLLVYLGPIFLLLISCTIYDIHMSYKERTGVLKQLQPKATNEEIKALLKDMDQGPTGLVGLTRGLIALTLILVLGIAAFHLILFAPKVPDIAEKLLTLLAGTLTAITGFYFGSRAATEAKTAATSQAQSTAQGPAASSAPEISEVNPTSGSAGAKVILTGKGFGKERGKGQVTFGGKEAEATAGGWDDGRIEVTVPLGLPVGNANIVVKNDNGNYSQAYPFQIKAS